MGFTIVTCKGGPYNSVFIYFVFFPLCLKIHILAQYAQRGLLYLITIDGMLHRYLEVGFT